MFFLLARLISSIYTCSNTHHNNADFTDNQPIGECNNDYTFTNCLFHGITQDAPIWVKFPSKHTLTVTHTTFYNCKVTKSGGGICFDSQGFANLKYLCFSNCQAARASAIMYNITTNFSGDDIVIMDYFSIYNCKDTEYSAITVNNQAHVKPKSNHNFNHANISDCSSSNNNGLITVWHYYTFSLYTNIVHNTGAKSIYYIFDELASSSGVFMYQNLFNNTVVDTLIYFNGVSVSFDYSCFYDNKLSSGGQDNSKVSIGKGIIQFSFIYCDNLQISQSGSTESGIATNEFHPYTSDYYITQYCGVI